MEKIPHSLLLNWKTVRIHQEVITLRSLQSEEAYFQKQQNIMLSLSSTTTPNLSFLAENIGIILASWVAMSIQ